MAHRNVCGLRLFVRPVLLTALGAILTLSESSAQEAGNVMTKPAAMAEAGLPDPTSMHLASLQALQEIVGMKSTVAQAIAANDIAAVTRLHTQIKARLFDARRKMDTAVLRGAWKPSGVREEAAALRNRLESVQILNFVTLAFLTGYEYPTKKVPASVIDANHKVFAQLDSVLSELQAFNGKVGSASAGKQRAKPMAAGANQRSSPN